MTPEMGTRPPTIVGRMLGAIIMLKVLLPVFVLAALVLGAWQIVSGISHTIETARAAVEPRIEDARKQIAAIRAEGDRLLEEVKKVKNTTTEIAGAVKQSVEPIRRSLLGLSGAMRTLSGTIESILNAIIKVVRKIPLTPNLRLVNLPDFNIPGLKLPNVNLDLDLTPDLSALLALNQHAQAIATQAERALDEIVDTLRFWWWTAKAAAAMILVWIALSLVGLAARAAHRFATGWQMVCGRRVEGALGLL